MTPDRTILNAPPTVGGYTPPEPMAPFTPPPPQSPVPGWLAALLLGVFSAGVAWATALATLSTKADRTEVDEIRHEQRAQHTLLERIDGRVAEMYCATLPLDKRAGCR